MKTPIFWNNLPKLAYYQTAGKIMAAKIRVIKHTTLISTVLICCSLVYMANGQNNKTVNLEDRLSKHQKKDTAKVNLLNKTAQEFLFVDNFWPDFTRQTLESAIASYQQRERRFGGLAG